MAQYLLPLAILGSFLPIALSVPNPQGNSNSSPAFPNPIESMPCTRHQDCSAKFPDSDCRNGRFCQCQKEFLLDFNKCLPVILDLTSECKIHAQCAKGLGELSRCNDETHNCECYDVAGRGKNSTAFFALKCYYRKALGDRCDLHEECKASIAPEKSVRCDVRTRTCTCEDGKDCENLSGASSILTKSLPFIITSVLAMKIFL